MEQKQSVVLALLVLFLCAGSGQAVRLLHDFDVDREFAFGSKAAAETEPLDPALDDDDYENEISRVEFEPELGSRAPHAVAAAAPFPAATVTAVSSSGPAPGPVMKPRNAAASARSMKWWLPPSTMPSFPLFPNPGGMPGIPGLPMPGMPFHPIGGWGAPAPPAHGQPSPPASGSGSGSGGNGNGNDPNTNGRTN